MVYPADGYNSYLKGIEMREREGITKQKQAGFATLNDGLVVSNFASYLMVHTISLLSLSIALFMAITHNGYASDTLAVYCVVSSQYASLSYPWDDSGST